MLHASRWTLSRTAKTFACGLALAALGSQALAAETITDLIKRDFQTAAAQYRTLLAEAQAKPGFPRTVDGAALVTVGPKDWTAGFFPGSLWYLFEATGDQTWKTAAIRYTADTAPAKFDKSQHDLGFMLGAGYGNGYRLTKDPAYRDALLAGATTLITRYNPKVGAIQSWDLWKDSNWKFPVIVDNMMNLELLMWAARAANEPRYREIAIAHADTTLRNHFRADASSYHLVDYDPQTGAVRGKQTVQGFANESSWARGQAWGLYGYTMMYRETRKPEYLAQARRIADFFMHHPRLPSDAIPYWDFDDTAIPNAPRDTSAAAITSSALLELAGFVDAPDAARYRAFAERQLRSLSSSDYLAAPGDNHGFLLKHATGHKPAGKEIDVPLNYADYYFLEALLRLRAMQSQ
jgi:rhamnogalacturonyl hydrolase YesR